MAATILICPWLALPAILLWSSTLDTYARESASEKVAWKRADLLFLLAAIYLRQGREEEARRTLVQVATIYPNHAPTRAILENL